MELRVSHLPIIHTPSWLSQANDDPYASWNLVVGNILCHVEGREGDFLIIRYHKDRDKFFVKGRAVLFDRKQKEPEGAIVE